METDGLMRVLSDERLGPYVAAMRGREGGLRLYEWNLAVSAAFYDDLSYLEVAMRNALHQQLSLHLGRDDWWDGADLASLPKRRT